MSALSGKHCRGKQPQSELERTEDIQLPENLSTEQAAEVIVIKHQKNLTFFSLR